MSRVLQKPLAAISPSAFDITQALLALRTVSPSYLASMVIFLLKQYFNSNLWNYCTVSDLAARLVASLLPPLAAYCCSPDGGAHRGASAAPPNADAQLSEVRCPNALRGGTEGP